MSDRRDPRVHIDVTLARRSTAARIARERLDALLERLDVPSLIEPVVTFAKNRPDRDESDGTPPALPPWASLRAALIQQGLATHGSVSSDIDVDAAVFRHLGAALASALKDAPAEWLCIVDASLPWQLIEHFLVALPTESITAHFSSWATHDVTTLTGCVSVTGMREENPENVDRWLKERRSAGVTPWRLVTEADRLHVHMMLDGTIAARTLIATHGGSTTLARWLFCLPHDYAMFLALMYAEAPALAVALAAEPSVLAHPWASACTFAHAMDILRRIDQSLQHAADGRWAMSTDAEFVAHYKAELQAWRETELPAYVDDLAHGVARHELAYEWLREYYVHAAALNAAKADSVTPSLRDHLAKALAAREGAQVACRKLCAKPFEPGGVLAAALIAHEDGVPASARADVLSAFVDMLSADDCLHVERNGDGLALYWTVAGLLSRDADPLTKWNALVASVPRDGEGWLRPSTRCREAELGHHCVIGAMAAEWLVAWRRPDDAKHMLTKVLEILHSWIRGAAATDDAVISWALEQAWARAPLCLQADAFRVASDSVALFDTVDELYATYRNLELNLRGEPLPPALASALAERYRLMRTTWRPIYDASFRKHYDVSAIVQWFDGLSEPSLPSLPSDLGGSPHG